jgi:hypothetical protein
MLKLLIVCATFSAMYFVAWIDGTAIFVAVFLVATISSVVDYKKEL